MHKISFHKYYFFFMLLILFLIPTNVQAGGEANDNDALRGVTTTKAIFDVHVSKPEKFDLFMQVIKQTHDDLVQQGQTPEFVVAIRGASIRFITTENWSYSEEDQKLLEKSALLIEDLKGRGVNFEACSVASRLYKVDPQTYLPVIKPVGNTFVSLIGYQSKGYGLVPVN